MSEDAKDALQEAYELARDSFNRLGSIKSTDVSRKVFGKVEDAKRRANDLIWSIIEIDWVETDGYSEEKFRQLFRFDRDRRIQ